MSTRDPRDCAPAELDPYKYAPALPDTGRIMDSVVSLHLKVDALTRIVSQLLRSIAKPEDDDPDPEDEDARTLEGDPAGRERDSSQPL